MTDDAAQSLALTHIDRYLERVMPEIGAFPVLRSPLRIATVSLPPAPTAMPTWAR